MILRGQCVFSEPRIELAHAEYFFRSGRILDDVGFKADDYDISRNVSQSWIDAIHSGAIERHALAIYLQWYSKNWAQVWNGNIGVFDRAWQSKLYGTRPAQFQQFFTVPVFITGASLFLTSLFICALRNSHSALGFVVVGATAFVVAGAAFAIMPRRISELIERFDSSASAAISTIWSQVRTRHSYDPR